MNADYAAIMAREMMDQHGLQHWQFGFDRAKRRLGVCSYAKRRIGLSLPFVLYNEVAAIRETILHEIAHALAGPLAGHGPVWRAVCLRIGAKPQRCCDADSVSLPQGKYSATCGGCNKTFHKHRKVKRQYHCIACGPTRGRLTYA
jgi:predicted SprT family Zn-dependent metalloprotease